MIIPSMASARLLSSLGFDLNFAHNSRNNQKPNLWLFWKNTIKALNVCSEQSISMIFYGHDELVLFSIIHVQTSLVKCRILWEDLKNLSCSYDIPWVILGDCNAIILSFEKVRGNPPIRTSCEEFADFVNSLDLIQATREGIRYLWTNNRKGTKNIKALLDIRYLWTNNRKGTKNIKALLDRYFVNQKILDLHENISWKVLQRISSDHSPIILQSCIMPKAKNIPFRFQHVSIEHPDYLEVVKDVWQEQTTGSPMFRIAKKTSNA
ncbi:hypothetical protein AMTRI_Chr08g206460 [Amborella trichopoda]